MRLIRRSCFIASHRITSSKNVYLLEQTIEGLGVTVPKGIRIYGTIKVFFFEAYADVTITYEDINDFNINIVVKISPINWLNGLIQISKAGDSSKGPHFILKAKPVSCQVTAGFFTFTKENL